MRLGLAICALLGAAGCQDNGGAVSVRWHIVDLTTGELINPRDHGGPGGSCVFDEPDLSALRSWSISKIRLVIADVVDASPDAREILSACDQRVEFSCSQAEATTPFSLPLGTYAMSLRATSSDSETVTPAPAVRTIKRAEVVNLDVVEIGVHPLPLATTSGDSDGGEPVDAAVRDQSTCAIP